MGSDPCFLRFSRVLSMVHQKDREWGEVLPVYSSISSSSLSWLRCSITYTLPTAWWKLPSCVSFNPCTSTESFLKSQLQILRPCLTVSAPHWTCLTFRNATFPVTTWEVFKMSCVIITIDLQLESTHLEVRGWVFFVSYLPWDRSQDMSAGGWCWVRELNSIALKLFYIGIWKGYP